MCQATVYLGDQVVAREVTWVELTEDGVRLATFFEEPRIVHGRIRQVDFLKHRVLLTPIEERENGRERETEGAVASLDCAQQRAR